MAEETKRLTPIKAIRSYCVNVCCGGHLRAPGKCEKTECPLYLYRNGHNPYAARKDKE